MHRRNLIKNMALWPLLGNFMSLSKLRYIRDLFPDTDPMPALFLGHGSPMNGIEENEFVQGFRTMAQRIPKPEAILCISAHWETRGTKVTAMTAPRTIHDFGGFPPELFAVQYPAPGCPELAEETKSLITSAEVELDHEWGLDHGAWTVIKQMYPDADIPVIQMSLDYRKDPAYHYALGQELKALRQKGILIIGSGNMVHNLRMVDWQRMNEVDYAYDWAEEASEKLKTAILNGDHRTLTSYQSLGKALQLAIPTPEHYLPLLYTMALQGKNEEVSLFNDKALAGSLTMTSVRIG